MCYFGDKLPHSHIISCLTPLLVVTKSYHKVNIFSSLDPTQEVLKNFKFCDVLCASVPAELLEGS